jgi:hypothetical protein
MDKLITFIVPEVILYIQIILTAHTLLTNKQAYANIDKVSNKTKRQKEPSTMSELSPRKATEVSRYYVSQLRTHDDFIKQAKEGVRQGQDEAVGLLNSLDEMDYAKFNGIGDEREGKAAQTPEEILEEIDKIQVRVASSAGKIALREITVRDYANKAKTHYQQNEGPYYDAAVAEAALDGVKLNLPPAPIEQTPSESEK